LAECWGNFEHPIYCQEYTWKGQATNIR
jgi:hypothetical protein